MSLERKYYARNEVKKPNWLTKAVYTVCDAVNTAVETVVKGVRVLKNNPGPVVAATLSVATPNFAGCGDYYKLENPDARVQSDRPIDDGSFDAGDGGTVNPDAGDSSTGPDGGDAQVGPDGQITTEADCNLTSEDEDSDGFPNCADTDCNGQSCGNGCTCEHDGVSGVATEDASNCGDHVDNDQDGDIDCVDTDCDDKSYANGAKCVEGVATEDGPPLDINSACYDGVDNDEDGFPDRLDRDCQGDSVCNTPCAGTDNIGDACFTNCAACRPGECNEDLICVTVEPPCN